MGTNRAATTYMGAHEASNLTLYTTTATFDVTASNIIRTASGVEVMLNKPTSIELYNINGILIEKTNTSGSYTHDLNNGAYIIHINGKTFKFIK